MANPERTPPTRLGEYRLVRRLGRGGMGQVWLAIDELLDRPVAIKLIDALDPDAAQRRRFMVEARAVARLTHPNVVAIHRVAELGGDPYIVAEWVRGVSLDQLPRPIDARLLVDLAVGLSRGLAAAHHAGVLHRDLKPANAILADDGTVKILDFGLAKLDAVEPSGDAPVAPATPAAAVVPPAFGEHAGTVSFATPDDAPADMAVAPAVTRRGAVLGTPYYMAPETWRGEPPTRRGDVYSLGALLFELAAGAPPFATVPPAELSAAVQRRDAPKVATVAPAIDPRIAAAIDRCLARDPAARFASGADVRAAVEALAAPAVSRPTPDGNPYRGLSRFEPEHASLLYGRDADISAAIDRLRSGRLVVLAGDSGVGKSSLARAGVLPAVAAGAIGDGRRWRTALCVPGRRPVRAIALALASAAGCAPDAIALDLPAEALQTLHAAAGDDGIVLLIDQLEELVTRAEPDEAAIVARWIAEVGAVAGPLAVVATVRGDQVTRVAALSGLAEELPRALHVVAPLDDAGLRAAITGPAETAGVRFEPPTLVDDLVEAGASDGGLPLLEFALAALWEARDPERGVVTRDALDALGGVAGALSRHADQVVAALPDPVRAAARRVLVELAAGGRTAAELSADVDPQVGAAIDALVAGRLVVARATPDGVVHDLAHERLAISWATLRGWLDEGISRRPVRQRVQRAAAEWQRLDRATAALWRDRRLDEARALTAEELGPTERAFVAASVRSRRRRRAAIVLAIASIPAVALAAWGWSRREARVAVERRVDDRLAAARLAVSRARSAAEALERDRRAAWARFDAGDREGGDAAWAAVLTRAAAVDAAWSEASNVAEAALLVDPARADTRALLADVLVERALLAERDHRASTVAELRARLALFDPDGTHAAAWTRPGEVALDVTPAGATIVIERFVDGAPSRWEVVAGLTAPAPAQTLPPGSYRAIARAAGRADGVLPFVVERGARHTLALPLPRADAVPAGFVYVPAGPYLTGVVAEESQRIEFFETSPLHPATTRAYLIARTETTWRDWIAMLDTLPPAERAARMPGSTTVGAQGEVALSRTDGVWEIRLAPTGTAFSARAGEPIRYPGRTRRASQDWLAMPVTGVSAVDARAYVAWLASRGVAGARLCSDAEWERAARGADGRMFPGGQHLGPDDANHQDTYGVETTTRGPDEVGSHPASDSPFGVQDLAGNAFELVAGATPDVQYVRGGAYAFAAIAARTELRDSFEPAMRDVAIGFRVCADAPPIE